MQSGPVLLAGARFKPSRKRPWALRLVAAGYFAAPLLMPLQVLLYDQPAGRNWLDQILRGPSLNAWAVMTSSVVVGYGIYQVRRWGWYLFLAHAAAILFNNVLVYRSMPGVPATLVLGANAGLLALIAYLVHSNLAAPFFNPKLRWWEQKERIRVTLPAAARSHDGALEGSLVDISESGAFVECLPERMPSGGDPFHVRLEVLDSSLECEVDVMWRHLGDDRLPPGIGIRFRRLSRADRARLRWMLRTLKCRGAPRR